MEHAADIYTRRQVGEDGKTAWERLKLRKCRLEWPEFGSQVMHRLPGKTKGGLAQPQWLQGTWLGRRWSSGEHIIVLESGKVVRARAIHELAEDQRWDAARVAGGSPWAPTGTVAYKGDEPYLEEPTRAASDEAESFFLCVPATARQ